MSVVGSERQRWWFAFATIAVLALGVLIRVFPGLSAEFPINDGGMHYILASELVENSYKLPLVSQYNHLSMPFVYPPLSTYVVALISGGDPDSTIDTIRILPGVLAALVVLAVWWMARVEFGSRSPAVLWSTLFFAVSAPAVLQFVKGGGVSRSLGLLLALLSVTLLRRAADTPWSLRWSIGAGLCAGLCVMAHPEASVFMVLGVGASVLSLAVSRAAVRSAGIAAAVAALSSAPWWGVTILRHGVDPFLAALSSNESGFSQAFAYLLHLRFSSSIESVIIAGLSALGLLAALAQRKWFVPIWLIALALFMHRGLMMVAPVLLSLLAARGLIDVVVPFLQRAITAELGSKQRVSLVMAGLAAFLVFHTLLVGYGTLRGARATSQSLNYGDREAAAWVLAHTSPDARFMIVTGRDWASDMISEWFPAITQRKSVFTCQGREWRGARIFNGCMRAHAQVQGCAARGVDCLLSPRISDAGYDFLWVSLRWNSEDDLFIQDLNSSPNFTVVYASPSVRVYQRTKEQQVPAGYSDTTTVLSGPPE